MCICVLDRFWQGHLFYIYNKFKIGNPKDFYVLMILYHMLLSQVFTALNEIYACTINAIVDVSCRTQRGDIAIVTGNIATFPCSSSMSCMLDEIQCWNGL